MPLRAFRLLPLAIPLCAGKHGPEFPNVGSAVATMPRVPDVTLDRQRGLVEVLYDPGALDPEAITQHFRESGYLCECGGVRCPDAN
ncbi:MAG TPA: hypothetical protein VNT60_05225 [Deinococcales bacterium]|nr:hypothetical protein [Deinococcales bacterium]